MKKTQRNPTRQKERDTVNGLMREAINNPGPDICTQRPTEHLSVVPTINFTPLLLLFGAVAPLLHLSLLLSLSHIWLDPQTSTLLPILPPYDPDSTLGVPRGSESNLSKTGFSLAVRKKNELGAESDVNTARNSSLRHPLNTYLSLSVDRGAQTVQQWVQQQLVGWAFWMSEDQTGPGLKLWPQVYTDWAKFCDPKWKNIDYIFINAAVISAAPSQLPPVRWRHEHQDWTVGQWKVARTDASNFYFRSRGWPGDAVSLPLGKQCIRVHCG